MRRSPVTLISCLGLAGVLTLSPGFAADSLPTDSIPPHVARAAKGVLVRKVGEAYARLFTLDGDRTRFVREPRGRPIHPADLTENTPYWLVAFAIRPEDKPFLNHTVFVKVDSTGRVLTSKDDLAVGDCVRQPRECEFPIDEQAARRLAKRAGLEEGLTSWAPLFLWNVEHGFIWAVSNTLRASADGAMGHTIVLDGNTGAFIARQIWSRVRGLEPESPGQPLPFPPSLPTEPVK